MLAEVKNKKLNYAFIDGQNLYQSIKEQNWKIDYAKFRIYLIRIQICSHSNK